MYKSKWHGINEFHANKMCARDRNKCEGKKHPYVHTSHTHTHRYAERHTNDIKNAEKAKTKFALQTRNI